MPSFSTLFQTVSFRGYDHQSAHDDTRDNPSDHCYWERGFPNVHMKTFNTFSLFRSQGRLLTRWKSFFYSWQPKSSQESSCFTCQTGKQKQRSLVSSCLGGIGIVVENLHVKKKLKASQERNPYGCCSTTPSLTRPESGLILIYIYMCVCTNIFP